jgi:hypothetical protein
MNTVVNLKIYTYSVYYGKYVFFEKAPAFWRRKEGAGA